MNYFEFYGLPVGFKLDMAALKRAYYAKSRELHPDFHVGAEQAAQYKALELSSFNNNAFQTLSNDDSRIAYLLQLADAMPEEGKAELPAEFLAEMMGINEQLMDLELDFDADAFRQAEQALASIERELSTNIAPVLANYSPAFSGPTELFEIKNYFFKRKYILRIKKSLAKFAPLFKIDTLPEWRNW